MSSPGKSATSGGVRPGTPLESAYLDPLRQRSTIEQISFRSPMRWPAVVSVFLQKLGIIHNEIGPGGMYPAGLAGAVGGTLLRRPLRAIAVMTYWLAARS